MLDFLKKINVLFMYTGVIVDIILVRLNKTDKEIYNGYE